MKIRVWIAAVICWIFNIRYYYNIDVDREGRKLMVVFRVKKRTGVITIVKEYRNW